MSTDPPPAAAASPGPGADPAGAARLRVDIFTIFPGPVESMAAMSVIGRARRAGLLDVRVRDLRDGAAEPHRQVDDAPFGGGAGMVMMPEPLFAAVEAADPPRPLLYLSPEGRRFDQAMAAELARSGGFSLLCGRYEGVDQRVRDQLVDGEVSVGDFVLSGGEVGALAVLEAAARLVPGVLGNQDSPVEESFADGLLEYPHYTRPADFRGWAVPEVLRSGDHARVERWRRAQALARTLVRRPDLIAVRGGLDDADRALLAEFGLDATLGDGVADDEVTAVGDSGDSGDAAPDAAGSGGDGGGGP